MSVRSITPVILAGGKGTRLWPMSRTAVPKQFSSMNGEESLFQQTLKRLCADPVFGEPVILANASHLSLVRTQLDEVGITARQIICEPVGRDTAAAIALASIVAQEQELGLLLVLPSDHKINNSRTFLESAHKAAAVANEFGKIVTFGVKPSGPATGYGYLEAGQEIADGLGNTLSRFIEKPELQKAKELLSKANVFWNAGMFLFSPRIMNRELEVYAPDLCSKVRRSLYDCDLAAPVLTPDEIAFSEIKPISIDYAVMEKTDDAALVPVDPQWTDVGSWGALWEASEQNPEGNVLNGNVLCAETMNSFVSSDGPFVGVAGISNVVVVANRDAVLVTSSNNSQSVKKLVAKVKEKDVQLLDAHVSEKRPWGSFTSLNRGESHQVKTISVEPGGRLSLQYHYHRAEHWIVVRGVATVTINDDVMQLTPCQQVFIPQGAVHRLENLTDETVEIIEVQYGSYLGEDDIVRVEDVYGRPDTEQPANSAEAA